MTNLPPTWAHVAFSSITTDASQRTPSADEQITYIDIGSVDRNSKAIVAPQRLLGADAPSRARKQVRSGDTLVSMTRPNLNAVALVPPELDGQIASTGFDVLRPVEGIDPRWIAYLVRTEAFVKAMSEVVQGALYPAVRSKDVRSYQLPLAPSAEQTRIADQLDKLLARVQACNDRIDAIPALLKRFRQAVLAAATSGTLTADWRAQREARVPRMDLSAESGNCVRDSGQLSYQVTPTPDFASFHPGYGGETSGRPTGDLNWPEQPLVDLCERERVITYGVIKLGDEVPDGIPCLRTSNVRWLHVDVEGVKRIAKSLSDGYDRTVLRGGEVLVNVRGTLGGVAVATPEMASWNVSREVAVVPVNRDIVVAKFLALWIGSERIQRWLGKVEKGVAYTGINIEDLRKLPVSVPCLAEQAEIVHRVESLFKLADRIEARYTAARAQAQRLTPLLLAKAFRGELVPQDTNDEPASALLERIHALIATPTTKPRHGRMSKSHTLLVEEPPC